MSLVLLPKEIIFIIFSFLQPNETDAISLSCSDLYDVVDSYINLLKKSPALFVSLVAEDPIYGPDFGNKPIDISLGKASSIRHIIQLKKGNLFSTPENYFNKPSNILWQRTSQQLGHFKQIAVNETSGQQISANIVKELDNGSLAFGLINGALAIQTIEKDAYPSYILKGHNKAVSHLIQLPNRDLVSCATDSTITFWRQIQNKFTEVQTNTEDNNVITLEALTNNSCLTLTNSGQVKLWQEDTNHQYQSQLLFKDDPTEMCAAIHIMDNKQLISLHLHPAKIKIWEKSTTGYAVQQAFDVKKDYLRAQFSFKLPNNNVVIIHTKGFCILQKNDSAYQLSEFISFNTDYTIQAAYPLLKENFLITFYQQTWENKFLFQIWQNNNTLFGYSCIQLDIGNYQINCILNSGEMICTKEDEVRLLKFPATKKNQIFSFFEEKNKTTQSAESRFYPANRC